MKSHRCMASSKTRFKVDLGHLPCCFGSCLSSRAAAEWDDVCHDSNVTDGETMTTSPIDVKLLRLTGNMWWWVIIYFSPVKPHQHLSILLLLFPLFSCLPFHISRSLICTADSLCKWRERRWQFQFDRNPLCIKSVDTASWLLLPWCVELYVQRVPYSTWQSTGGIEMLKLILPPGGRLRYFLPPCSVGILFFWGTWTGGDCCHPSRISGSTDRCTAVCVLRCCVMMRCR